MVKTKSLYWLMFVVVYIVVEMSRKVDSLDSLEQCPPVNIFATHDSIFYYIKSVKYLQHSILVENLSGLRPGSGLGISWAKTPAEESSYALQITFKHYLVICCIALNRNITNVREYDIKLLDKNGNYLVPEQPKDPTKFTADSHLFVDMSKKAMGSYGVELTVRRTAHIGEPPANIEISMMLCEKSANVSEKLRQQQLLSAKVKDMYLLDACTSDDQCDKLITGNARCDNGTCKCVTGYEINKFECSKDDNDIENSSFGSKNINNNFIERSRNRTVRFYELNRIDCLQDRDCQSTFLDLNMLCIRQKCVCTTGYRLLQVPNFAVKCIKAIGGSTLKYPQNCEAPTGCDFHLSFFVFQAPSDDSSVPPPSPPQRYASITLITDVRHYINEYYQVVLNEEKIKFFVDNDGIMRVVLDEKFNKFYKSLAQQDGYRIRVSREAGNNPPPSVEDEPVLVRKPRYVLQSLTNTSNITKENSQDIIIQYDPEEYKYLSYYINSWYYDAGNLTYYNFEFNTNFSNLILNTMFTSGSASSSNDSEPITCQMFKLNRGNFVQMASSSSAPTKIQFFFESKHMTRLTGFLFCLILNQPNTNTNQCKNGVQLYESKYPISSSVFNQTRFHCHCWTGYWGTECDVVNPCYTMLTNTTHVPNPTEPLPFSTKLCMNEGVCMPTKSSAMHYYISKIKYVPYCLCRPQFAGKTCERNLDGCSFPFIYGNKYYNKCLINQTTGIPWCSKVPNLDLPEVGGLNSDTTATCTTIPCKRPWKHQNMVQTNKCIYKRYQDEKGFYESPFCSLTRNFELFRTWRFCEKDDFI